MMAWGWLNDGNFGWTNPLKRAVVLLNLFEISERERERVYIIIIIINKYRYRYIN